VLGVTVTRASMLAHARTLTTACNYTEGEIMVCVLDFKREVGLWHAVIASVFNGMHVIFIPYALMKVTNCLRLILKRLEHSPSILLVKSLNLDYG
jgi:acyl-coenzyme A synthetase/AMP-(fatty) acid ligase